jgi:hypothetical protein
MHNNRRANLVLVGRALYIAVLCSFAAADADDRGLFGTTNQNPFVQIHSAPSPAPSPAPAPGNWVVSVTADLASNSIVEEHAALDRVVLDGETYRTTLSISYGLSERFTAELTLPFVAHSGGFMDSFIEDWHDLWGLSNNRRDDFDRDSLDFSYAEAGQDRFALRDRDRGLGDLRLSTEWRLRDAAGDQRSLAIRGGLKLPTGSADALTGSGSTDVSLQLLSTDNAIFYAWDVTLAWMIGGLWLGDGDVLEDLRRDAVAIGSIGLSRPVWRNLTARLQIDGHSAFYDSRLAAIGSGGLQLTFGGSIELARGGRIDIAMMQNLNTDAIPDLGLHLAWREAF